MRNDFTHELIMKLLHSNIFTYKKKASLSNIEVRIARYFENKIITKVQGSLRSYDPDNVLSLSLSLFSLPPIVLTDRNNFVIR